MFFASVMTCTDIVSTRYTSCFLRMAYRLLFMVLIISSINGFPHQVLQRLHQQLIKSLNCPTLKYVNNMYYLEAERKELRGTPSDLRIRFKTKDIYYTFISKDMRMSLQIWHSNGNMETIQVKGLGQSTGIDNLNDIVYLATDNGVYKYANGILIPYTLRQEDVMYIAVDATGEVMYIATWPHNRVYKVTKNGAIIQEYPEIPSGRRLTIDRNDNIYFDANKTWYVLKRGEKVPVTIRELPQKNLSFDALNAEVFAMDDSGYFYAISPDNATASLLGHFDVTELNTFAIDSSYNIVVGTNNELIKYKKYNSNPCQDERK